jgi:hypothetical protein
VTDALVSVTRPLVDATDALVSVTRPLVDVTDALVSVTRPLVDVTDALVSVTDAVVSLTRPLVEATSAVVPYASADARRDAFFVAPFALRFPFGSRSSAIFAARVVLSHENSGRPKWPYAAVAL